MTCIIQVTCYACFMQHTRFGAMECPVALSLDKVGEWWSMLILRDAFHGLTRFDEFQESLGVATNTLTRRLNSLVKSQLLERKRYSNHPPRYDYVLTPKGRDFLPVLLALMAWGNRHCSKSIGPSVVAKDIATGAVVDPIIVDRHTMKPLNYGGVSLSAGPGAGRKTMKRVAWIAMQRGRTP